jgi:hypothetical protein
MAESLHPSIYRVDDAAETAQAGDELMVRENSKFRAAS